VKEAFFVGDDSETLQEGMETLKYCSLDRSFEPPYIGQYSALAIQYIVLSIGKQREISLKNLKTVRRD
jgi:hypothetical protein